MIAIIELSHFAYSHESFNAGTVYQLSLAFPNEKIRYYAEKEQINRVSKIIPKNNNISFEIIDMLERIKKRKILPSSQIYESIINHILEEGEFNAIILTGYEYAHIIKLPPIIQSHPKTEFFFFQHGEIEQLISSANKIEKWGIYSLPTWKYRLGVARVMINDYFSQIKLILSRKKRKNINMYLKHLELLAQCSNVHFFVFSNEYMRYELPLSDNVIKKFIKIFLPYVFDKSPVTNNKNDNIIRILVCSSTAEAKDGIVWKIINYVNANSQRIHQPYKFVLGGGDCRKISNVVPYIHQDRGQHDLSEAMSICNYLLLPYPARRYALSSSAVLTDAINMQLPIIMGASGCFNDYEKYNIGERGYSVREIAEIVINLINSNSKNTYGNYHFVKLKEEMLQSNLNCFRKYIVDNFQ